MYDITAYDNSKETWGAFEVKYPELDDVEETDYSTLYNAIYFVANSSDEEFKNHIHEYFENKEDLYFFLIDTVMAEMARDMSDKISSLSKDLYERVIEYSTAEISWYAKNPVKGRFIIGVASEDDPDITKKIIGRYGKKSSDIYHELLSEVDLSCIKNDKEKAGDILQWVLEGFNRAFLENVSTERDIDELEREYISKLKEYLSVLKNGL